MTSLRRKLLAWLLPASLLLLLAGAVNAYFIALRTAGQAYDRVLLDAASDIADEVRIDNGAITVDLAPPIRKILLNSRTDHLYFLVLGPGGEFVGGTHGLPPGPADASPQGVFYDTAFNGESLRAVAVLEHKDGIALRIVVAESVVARNALMREIWIGVLVPEVLLLIFTCVLLLVGVRYGLAPLAGLTRELSYRSQFDLSRVDQAQAPEEVQPLLTEINRLLQRLDTSQQVQRAFISNAAHQIRTPVAALQAQVELALRHADGGQLAADLEQVLATVRRIVHVSNRLLALARSEPGTAAKEFCPVDLYAIAREVGETWVARALAKDIDLGFEAEHATVEGSAPLLHELLGNLVDNAILYTPNGGRVTVRMRREDGAVALEVEDNGPGIPADERARIFERFYRPAGSPDGGCGLGLAIVAEIARLHGAEVSIREPARGTGSVFRVRFPGR